MESVKGQIYASAIPECALFGMENRITALPVLGFLHYSITKLVATKIAHLIFAKENAQITLRISTDSIKSSFPLLNSEYSWVYKRR
jgi:hypothetical protein